jgi:hypothetical protein
MHRFLVQFSIWSEGLDKIGHLAAEDAGRLINLFEPRREGLSTLSCQLTVRHFGGVWKSP